MNRMRSMAAFLAVTLAVGVLGLAGYGFVRRKK